MYPITIRKTGSVKLRRYQRDDLDALFRLDELCFAPQFRFSRRSMRSFAEAPNAHVLLAEVGDQLAGFCIVHLEMVDGASCGYLVTLDVSPEQRRKGVAGNLMDEAEAQALIAGCTAMLLHVFRGNSAARSFYEGRGYAVASEAKDFYGWGVDGLLYSKPLRTISETP